MNDGALISFWCAYLLLAIRDMDDHATSNEASEFVLSKDRRPLGFVWTCEQLGIDSELLQEKCRSRAGRMLIKHGNHYTHRRLKRAA